MPGDSVFLTYKAIEIAHFYMRMIHFAVNLRSIKIYL